MRISVQEQDFSIDKEVEALVRGRGDIGAVATFSGLVRGDNGITQMTLEHYPGMTEKQLEAIAQDAMERFSLDDCLIIHRYGTLKVGERIVLVITLSKSRKAAFQGAEFLMDWLKTQAPFWKKESNGNESKWVDAKAEDKHTQEKWK
ncbi:MAG: molybdenum cofactor biosynthesis protein MoaE [Sphingomonadales bacterium]|nr:molybdenum cofactor biosynthesis protein MoaE [Sphingomonadales bacterium]